MRKLKYGLLLILSMILFSVPVLAAKTTYYLPSKVVYNGGYRRYSYDKYGHVIKRYVFEEEEGTTQTWKYKYDKKGKRISGEEYWDGKLFYKLTFDKNDRLKTIKDVTTSEKPATIKWNSKGYIESENSKYAYYKNGKIKKLAIFDYNTGELMDVAYYDKSGLRSKNPPERNGNKDTYGYVLDKNGLVKTKTIEERFYGSFIREYKEQYYYSKTKTDAKTYYMFIDGCDSCINNGKL